MLGAYAGSYEVDYASPSIGKSLFWVGLSLMVMNKACATSLVPRPAPKPELAATGIR